MDLDCADCRFLNPSEIPEMRCKNGDRADFRFNLVLKPLAARPRPCWIDEQVKLLVAAPKDYSFPSGHSAASFAAAVSIFVMHKKEGAAALILACLIAFSRLYLFVHFPTDVLAGIAVGFICAFLAAKIQNGFLLHSRGR